MLSALGAAHAAEPAPSKQAPPGFAAQSSAVVDRSLYWQGRERSGIVFVGRSDAPDTYLLAPASVAAFRRFLTGLGIEAGAAGAYAERTRFTTGEVVCLPLAATPLDCVEISLRAKDGDRLELIAAGAKPRPAEAPISRETGLVGSTLLGLGVSHVGSGAATLGSTVGNFSVLTRGIATRDVRRFEYDLGAQGTYALVDTPVPREGSSTTLQVNLLAASTELGEGRVYGGAFRTASPTDLLAGNSTYFFARPTAIGMAYKSAGEAFGGGRRQRVRVQLTTTSLVRIVSGGVTLAEGTFGPGDQYIPFRGFTEGFVEVVVRDSSGREQTERAQVLPDLEVSLESLATQRFGNHFYYVDAGRVFNSGTTRYTTIGLTDDYSATAIYTYTGAPGWLLQGGAQWVGTLTRLGATVGDVFGRYRLTGTVGSQSEYGVFASYNSNFSFGLNFGVNGTWYRPPRGVDGFASRDCIVGTASACYALSRYQSINANLSMTGFPVSVGYLSTKTRTADTQLFLVQGSVELPWLVRGATMLALGSFQPNSSNYSVSATLVVPLGFATSSSLTSTASTDSSGAVSGALGASGSFSEDQYTYLRAASLSGNYTQGGSLPTRGSIASTVQAQLGPVNSTVAVAVATGNSYSAYASFNSLYAVTAHGIALNDSTANFPLIDPFLSSGPTGVAIFNRSNEPQTVIGGGRNVTVAPGSNLLLPLSPGVLPDIVVSPGPTLNADDVSGPVYLHKGNVRSIVIPRGLWVTARFVAQPSLDAPDGRLRPEFTLLANGAGLERVYPDSRGRILLFELLTDDAQSERYIIVAGGRTYGCVARVPQVVQAEFIYPDVVYRCAPAVRP